MIPKDVILILTFDGIISVLRTFELLSEGQFMGAKIAFALILTIVALKEGLLFGKKA